MPATSLRARFGATGCIVLPVSLFAGLMIASAGIALYPPVAFIATPLVCGGEVEVESRGASYRPGEYTVTRNLYCVSSSAGGKAVREDITFKAVGAAFLAYSVIAFLLLRFIAAPLLRRRFADALGSARVHASPAGIQTVLDRVKEIAERRRGGDPGSDDLAADLAQLKRLRDDGLITAQDYEAKKAEILSRL